MRRPITATYRLQLRGPQADPAGRRFGFAEAAELVDYLADLGVSHLYLSPILTADPTSNHNYDVIDATEVNPELGGIEGLRELARTAHAAGLGLIIDIVPNHMSVATPYLTPWWWDVLKNGQDSEFEPYFDIDFSPDNGAGGKIGLPILGQEGDEDKLTIEHNEHVDELVLAYYEHHFPIAPGTCDGPHDDPAQVYARQHYRLMYWRDGVISYRRFFSVNTLAGIRQEDPLVFEHTHRVLRQLCAEDIIDGVRVDHPDGLADPFAYLHRLRDLIGPDRWLVIEKILAVNEPLDPRLSVDGTTGYDALRELDGVFVSREAEDTLSMVALRQSGSPWDETSFQAIEQQLKRDVAASELAAEVSRLARAIRRDNFSTAGSTVSDELLISTVIELVAAIPVYRADYESLSRVTSTVFADMASRFPSRRDALDLIAAAFSERGEANTRFAQVCGAVMAKGVEDTTFYRACRLVALQEVGGAPGRFGVSSAEFHLLNDERARLWPRAMTTLTTHDTKRSEDVRSRIIGLTEIPTEFAEFVDRLSGLVPAPDPATGLFLLQNLIGVWPADGAVSDTLVQRFQDYSLKAIREAGVRTSWVDQDPAFETAVADWVDALMRGPAAPIITAFVAPLADTAVCVSLSRKLLQLIAPGIPDVYQGQELFDDSLVDPDNRRFVDYTARRQLLQQLDITAELRADDDPNLALLHTVREALRLRRRLPEMFDGGRYEAVFAEGPRAGHLVGMARGYADSTAVIAVGTRRPHTLDVSGGWQDTTLTLPEGEWVDKLSGRRLSGVVPAADVFADFPTALLVNAQLDEQTR
ncbi:malto-oligosyltrehalose synthase [Corynebacterium uterequi]|uniref:Malto-oligosyltrehalose synthase n=1 Tax=Corynebacterium uterequi TaxID=1072256 RepID=A0A0G3HHL2_9CORY|nr:malto-oligosyltrehalose synthase [Corynebacterium uterequi]AKK11428.1 malto-oligosyltrehalose synthase [Corynebacterium uterequi]